MVLLAQFSEGISHTDFYAGMLLVLLGYAVQWGIQRQKTKGLEQAVEQLRDSIRELKETVNDRILPRHEYESRHKDLQNRLQRLEDKEFMRGRRWDAPETGE